jgi:hypothetical protein
MSKIVVIVFGTILMFAAWFSWQQYVSNPLLDAFCGRSCSELGLASGSVDSGYVATRSAARCRCYESSQASQKDWHSHEGYFFSRIAWIDWILLVAFRLFAAAILVFLALFALGRLLMKWQS